MRLSAFDFALPPERIAQHPAQPRDAARLLQVGPDGLADRRVSDLPALLRPGDVLVVNDTRVIPAQLQARRGDARIGITLDRPRPDGAWQALARNARRLRSGDRLTFAGDAALEASVVARAADGAVVLRFNSAGADFAAALRRAGAVALPPYIDRPGGLHAEDVSDYQTIFAARDGAVAAPTAGLHFTPALKQAVERMGVSLVTVTLHVGIGTFLPVRTDDVSQHHMHSERGEISEAAARKINLRGRNIRDGGIVDGSIGDGSIGGGRLIAVGTTSLRLLESAADAAGMIQPFAGETDLFILPGYRFRAVDVLMTNFHLPRSTLFMLVCAFAGTDRMRAAYAHAIEAGYRFYSYGDACLLERRTTTRTAAK